MRSLPILALMSPVIVMLAAACSKGPEPSQSETVHVDVRSSPTMIDPHRASAQQLAILVGSSCSEPTRMEFKGDKDQKAFYALDCGSSSFLVGVKADGTGDALACLEADRQGAPCWKPW